MQNAEKVQETVDHIRSEFGSIRGIIHGAGVLADRKIEDLTDDLFESVYATKVDGLRNLLLATSNDPLHLMAFFSSSTGRFGRIGQSAYAAANEVLNKIAQQQARLRPDSRVVSINWGPWEGGMVTPALKEVFAREGVECIPLNEGADFFVRELTASDRPVEVVALAGSTLPTGTESNVPPLSDPIAPPPLALVFEHVLSLDEHPFLGSHVIDSRAVLPMAVHLEWLAHGALHNYPGWQFHGCNQFRILNGIHVEEHLPASLRVVAGKATRQDGLQLIPMELRGRKQGREVIHSRAEIVLTTKLPNGDAPTPVGELDRYPHAIESIYREFLFHGKFLQSIETIEGSSEHGFVGWSRTAPEPTRWMDHPLRGSWIADPLVIDASFQMMILWTYAYQGSGSLPCFIRNYRQYRKSFGPGAVRIQIQVTRATGALTQADIDFVDAEGNLIARINDYECVVDPTLNEAFRKNKIK